MKEPRYEQLDCISWLIMKCLSAGHVQLSPCFAFYLSHLMSVALSLVHYVRCVVITR